MRRTKLLILSACALVVGLAPAGATSVERMDLAELTAASTAIVQATCLGGESSLENGVVVTRTRFRVIESLKGAVSAELEVLTPGGIVAIPGRTDGLAMMSRVQDAPQFLPGEESVLFLWRDASAPQADPYQISGLSAGRFALDEARTVRTIAPRSLGAPAEGTRIPAVDFIDQVRRLAGEE